jgi:hypothetical protein
MTLPDAVGPSPSRVSNQLTKAQIINVTSGDVVTVMFNPDELRLEQGNAFAEVGVPGLDIAPLQYVRGKARALTMELFFDTYETREDVRTYTSTIVGLLDTDPHTHAPPVLVFAMGGFRFQCVLVDAGQRFTMFLPDGTPVRSYLSVRLQEYAAVTVDIERGLFFGSPTASAAANAIVDTGRAIVNGDRVHVSLEGETLSGIAAAELGDAARWRDIAHANDIEDVFGLKAGTQLVIPANGPAASGGRG